MRNQLTMIRHQSCFSVYDFLFFFQGSSGLLNEKNTGPQLEPNVLYNSVAKQNRVRVFYFYRDRSSVGSVLA